MTAAHEYIHAPKAAVLAATVSGAVPVLYSERLTLSAPQIEDFEAYFEIVGGPRGQHVGGPMPRDEAWYDFIQMSACWMLQGHGGWTLRLSATGETVGFVILGLEPGDKEPELGFLLLDAFEGRGLAHEAALVARDFAIDTLGLPELVSYVDPDNTRSARLAERLGAKRDALAEAQFDETICVYRHLPEVIS